MAWRIAVPAVHGRQASSLSCLPARHSSGTRVLDSAVRNARSRAEVIATASGQKLGAIHSIEYGHTEILIRSRHPTVSSSSASTRRAQKG